MFKLNLSAKTRLLSGASLIAITLGAQPVSAMTVSNMAGRSAAQITATRPTSSAASAAASVTQAATATAQGTRDLSAAIAAIKAQMSVQAAAHAAAQAAAPTVPNGLTNGGLKPDSGLAKDGTANTVITWVNANTPTQTTNSDGSTTVTIKQTDQKAIANWSSFNVGNKTTVHFDQSSGTTKDGSNSWVILNRVAPTDAAPSQIFGTIKAEGSVYLLNNNGVIFGGSSQVNTHSLVVSSLNLFSNDFAASNNRFLTGGIGDLNQTNYQTNEVLFTSDSAMRGDVKVEEGANIEVGANGLILMAAPNVTNNGQLVAPKGQVALVSGIGVSYDYNKLGFGNSGWTYINGVYTQIFQGFDDGKTSFLDFASYGELFDGRGNDITPLGTATNNGFIYATEGNITMAGAKLAQNGVMASTTSVKSAGSIALYAMYEMGTKGASSPVSTYDGFTPYYRGSVSLGKDSVTTILASDNGATIPSDASSLSVFSRNGNSTNFGAVPTSGFGAVTVYGQNIDLTSGSLVYAPSQNVTFNAAVAADPRYASANAGRVLIEDGAIVDVSGLPDVKLSITDNLLTVTFAGNELANSPLQRDGVLYGKNITVDLRDTGTDPQTGTNWVGTDVATLNDYLNLVQNTVGQLMTDGGTIAINGPEVIAQKSSVLNVMGGYEHFLGAWAKTTRLIGQNGSLIDISDADPLQTYVGIAGQVTDTDSKWGVSTTYTNGLLSQGTYEHDYIQGGVGGTLSISSGRNQAAGGGESIVHNAGALVLQSTILANSVAGNSQVSGGTIPMAGTINIFTTMPLVITDPARETNADYLTALDVPNGFNNTGALLAQTASPYTTNVLSSAVLDSAQAANIAITTGNSRYSVSGDLTIGKGASLVVQNGGSISFNVFGKADIDGSLTAHAGSVSVTTVPLAQQTYSAQHNGDIDIGSDALIDVSGIFSNEYRDGVGTASTQYINGGSIKLMTAPALISSYDYTTATNIISLDMTGNITLEKGSRLDLSSGGLVLPNGNLMTGSNRLPLGQGGNLTISTYYSTAPDGSDGTFTRPVTDYGNEFATHGFITIDGSIDALGFTGGGTISIGAVAMQIGGDATQLAANEPDSFYFDPVSWGDRGFSSFHLSAVQEIRVPDNTTVDLMHNNLVLDGFSRGALNYEALADLDTGAKVSDHVNVGRLSGTALSPTSLFVLSGTENFNTPNTWTGNDQLYLGKGASIVGDPGAAITLETWAMIDIEGAITAPGGSITVSDVYYYNPYSGNNPPNGPVYIGKNAVLDVSGTTVLDPLPKQVYTANGWVTPKTGKVLAGGTITLVDTYSPIVVAPGAVLDVSGAAGTLQLVDVAAGVKGSAYTVKNQQAYSDAGSVNVQAGYTMIFEGTLEGAGGSPAAAGGTFTLKSIAPGDNMRQLLLIQDTADARKAISDPFDFATYVPMMSNSYYGQVDPAVNTILFGVDSLKNSGFENLSVQAPIIGFEGQIRLALPGTVSFNTLTLMAASDAVNSPLSGLFTTGTWDPTQNMWVYTTDNASLKVDAGYVALGWQPVILDPNFSAGYVQGGAVDGSILLHGKAVDVIGGFSTLNAGVTTIASDDAIRLLPQNRAAINGSSLAGSLSVSGDLNLIGTTIYPATGTLFTVSAPGTLTISYPDGVGPSATTPLSVGSILVLDAKTINQNGEVQAPFGQIYLGLNGPTTATNIYGTSFPLSSSPVVTQAVNLGAGSITSVSANGANLPFGTTVDKETWVYDPFLNYSSWYGPVATIPDPTAYTVTGAPQGVVTMSGKSVTMDKAATVDLSGGGNVHAVEWINGTGGTRDVLAGSQKGSVYAIVPGVSSANAPFDIANANQVAAGKQIYLSGVKGLADGWYTLLPAAYANEAGAYRVVVTSTTNPMNSTLGTLSDGTVVTEGQLGNAFTGSQSSDAYLVQVQSGDVWKRYSEYSVSDGDSFFPTYATKHSLAAPYTPIDAGRLVITAGTALDLGGGFKTGAGKDASGNSGSGAQLDLSGALIEITATDAQTPLSGYVGVSADMLNDLDFTSILIGGTRTNTKNGTLINITSNGVVVANDADHPLQAPEIMLVAAPAMTSTNVSIGWYSAQVNVPVAGTGQVVLQDGSVIKATGSTGKAVTRTLLLGVDPASVPAMVSNYNSVHSDSEMAAVAAYYAAASKGAGSLVRVSNGAPVQVKMVDPAVFQPGNVLATDTGQVTVLPQLINDTGVVVNGTAQLLGGSSLTFASTGNVAVDASASLSGTEIDANADTVTFLGAGATSANGLNFNQTSLLNLAKSSTVNLEAASNIVFEGDVNVVLSGDNSSLTLGGNALESDGGKVALTAGTVTFDDQKGRGSTSFAAGSGSLSINASEIGFGAGNKTLVGFGSVDLNASKGVVTSGTGTTDFGTLDVALKTPVVIADTGSTQTVKTTGNLSAAPSGGTAMTSNGLGGAVTLQGGTVSVAVPVQALSGNIILHATSGDVTVAKGGALIAKGITKTFVDKVEYDYAGSVKLAADNGNVALASGSSVDVSGIGGTLGIQGNAVSLDGTLTATPISGFTGASFVVNTKGSVDLDTLAGKLTTAGFSKSVEVTAGTGDLSLSQTLKAQDVLLDAENGQVAVSGMIDASDKAGGMIELFGTRGVDIEGSLIATGSASDQLGGTVMIGTSGLFDPTTGTYNPTYGYENIANSGQITIGKNARIDVSGGTVSGKSGGTVLIRTPLLQDGTVNVTITDGATITGARSVTLEPYASWSTADTTTGAQHFDGIIDPSGWYNANGHLLSGSFTDYTGTTIANWDGTAFTNVALPDMAATDGGTISYSFDLAAQTLTRTYAYGQGGSSTTQFTGAAAILSFLLANDYFTPDSANANHQTFYGYVNGDVGLGRSGTLMSYIQGLNVSVANSDKIANFQVAPGVELKNPNGDIKVLTNWNLGAQDGNGNALFRTGSGIAPIVTFRASGNLDLNASITDGFVQVGDTIYSKLSVPRSYDTYADIWALYTNDSNFYGIDALNGLGFLTPDILAANGVSLTDMLIGQPFGFADLGLSSKNSYDAYYALWNTYSFYYGEDFFQNLQQASWGYYSLSANGFTLANSTADQLAAAGATGWVVDNVVQYAQATLSALDTLRTDVGNITDAASYRNYLMDYAVYAGNWSNWAQYLGWAGFSAATLPSVPMAPPRSIASEYVLPTPNYPTPAEANSPNVMPTAYNQAAISGMALNNSAQSASYRFVAGANQADADPLGVTASASGNVVVDGYTLIRPASATTYVIGQPTTIRTGTGNIDIAAAGDFSLANPMLPGTVYTAGKAAEAPTASDAATLALGLASTTPNNGQAGGTGISVVLTSVVNPTAAGDITLKVGGDIQGVELAYDSIAFGIGGGEWNATQPSGLSSNPGGYVGQLWTAWLLADPNAPNTPWYVNFGSFDQGIMSTGGNVAVSAGGNIRDLAVSLPTTAWLDPNNVNHVFGGGNLAINAGGGIYGGNYYVGNGTGSLRAGGEIASDLQYASPADGARLYAIPTVLGVQYATFDVASRLAADIGGAYDPTYLFVKNYDLYHGGTSPVSNVVSGTQISYVPYVTSMSGSSGLSVRAATGAVTFNDMLVEPDLISNGTSSYANSSNAGYDAAGTTSLLLPSSLELVSFDSDVNVAHGGGLYPSATGTLQLLAQDSINIYNTTMIDMQSGTPYIERMGFPTKGNVSGYTLTLLDYPVGAYNPATGHSILPTASAPIFDDASTLSDTQLHDANLWQARAGNVEPVRVYALTGNITDGLVTNAGTQAKYTISQVSLIPNSPTEIYAGGNITDLPFFGENFQTSDITSVIAGGSITYNLFGSDIPNLIELAGPGSLYVQAGGDVVFKSQRLFGIGESGIITLGNQVDHNLYLVGVSSAVQQPRYNYVSLSGDFGNPTLPAGGADVEVVYGAKYGLNTADFISTYIKATDSNAASADYLNELNAFLKKQKKGDGALSADAAWTAFQSLSDLAKRLFVTEVYFDILDRTGIDYNNPLSGNYQKYGRGYQAINTLFPSAWGYTANSLNGGSNGANTLVNTGLLDIRGSRIQTGQGGNISILGPGGRVLVGSASASIAANPASEGIITFESGNIDIFADQSILVAESRIMTEQGGNLVVWSSNGDINAGKGAKTAVSNPPPAYACDVSHYCVLDARGVVTGAGIASLQTLEDSPLGNVDMVAPRGTVDAGAAGIRVSGNLNIAAMYVANAFNITVKGTAIGIPTLTTNLNLATVSNAATEASSILNTMKTQEPQNTVDVEVTGYGGLDSDHPERCIPSKSSNCPH